MKVKISMQEFEELYEQDLLSKVVVIKDKIYALKPADMVDTWRIVWADVP